MTRTMWIAVFCLVGLGPTIAIRVVTRPASLAVEAAQDQRRTELALAPNEAAKADRLPLHDIRAETEVMPAAQSEPSETPPTGPDETVRIPGRRWQDANAKALPGENLPRTGSGVDTGDENTSNNEPEASVRVQAERKRLQGRSVRAASSARGRRKANRKRGQQSAEAERSLALPAGRDGKRFEVAEPFAEMQHVNSVKLRLRLRSDSNLSPSMPRIFGIDLTRWRPDRRDCNNWGAIWMIGRQHGQGRWSERRQDVHGVEIALTTSDQADPGKATGIGSKVLYATKYNTGTKLHSVRSCSKT